MDQSPHPEYQLEPPWGRRERSAAVARAPCPPRPRHIGDGFQRPGAQLLQQTGWRTSVRYQMPELVSALPVELAASPLDRVVAGARAAEPEVAPAQLALLWPAAPAVAEEELQARVVPAEKRPISSSAPFGQAW